MNVFYEEEGSFKVASVMSEAESSLQVESTSGKRSKIKAANVLMKFDGNLQSFMEAATAEAQTLEIDFLWECCGAEEFGFEQLAQDYFGTKPTPIQAAAVAIKLHSAPMYFYRKGKGVYKAATAETLKAALAGLEKKRLQAELVAQMVAELKSNKLPEAIKQKLQALFYAPDKNSLEWKALDLAAAELKTTHIEVLRHAGAIERVHDYHLGAFLHEYFANGCDYPVPDEAINTMLQVLDLQALPQASVEAFSIDDATTTEIDDALSVTPLPNGNTRVGIHIAAPAIGVAPNTALDTEVMRRLSTVYMPGHKITMLPEAAIRPFSLDAGTVKPALSLYLEVAPDFSIVASETQLELVKIAENLRHDSLEPYFNAETLAADSGHPYWAKLLFLFNFSESLEKARGKYDPTRPPQVDYNFYVDEGKVRIVNRQRGSPMDKLVAELMIAANSQWGALLATHKLPGIYRAQNGGKVYMTLKPEPHQGLGVAQYAWSTSPLRRATDLINQRQLIAAVQNAAAPYPNAQSAISEHMRKFELIYNAYNDFQTRMERYWCLQYLVQEQVQEIAATVWRDNLVRLENLPYVTKVPSLPPDTPAGARVLLEVKRVDTLLMELDCKFKTMLEAAPVAEMELDDAQV